MPTLRKNLSPFAAICTRAALLLLLAATPLAGQSGGTIRGTVVDAFGTALPDVPVTATGPGVDAEAFTDAEGAFEFTGVAPGDLTLTASLFGYATRVIPVTVRAGAVETVQIVRHPFFQIAPLSVVAEEPTVFARNFVAEPMMRQQSSITAVTSVIDNLPGVSVQEGDAYSFDDWSSNVVMRGFQTTYNDAQIGTTIDGFPNGTSDYWSGAKANRFVDPMNLGGVEVSQGTADIASRSVEALGGTLNFLTADPSEGASQTASVMIGENEGQRFARAGRDRIAVRRHDAGVGRRDPAGGDRLDGGLGEKRAGALGRQDRVLARQRGAHRLPLLRRHPRGCLPAAFQRRGSPSAPAFTATTTGGVATGCRPSSSTWSTTGPGPSRSSRAERRCVLETRLSRPPFASRCHPVFRWRVSTTVPSNGSWAMITKPRIAHTLAPSLMLAASVAFPVGAGAQAAPPPVEPAPLSAAMAEARRSPFHRTSNVEGLTIVELALLPGPHVGDRPDPDSAQAPSFHRVFWPTLGAVALSEAAFFYGFLNCFGSTSDCTGGLLLGAATLVAGPPAVSSIMGARFSRGLLGSAAGVGLGLGLFYLGEASGLDDSTAFWSLPITHALLTTVISRL